VRRPEEALAPAKEAVTTYRTVVEANPDASLLDLAGALNNLGNRLAEVGQWKEALTPAQEAVTTYRRLAEANPDAHLPSLAKALTSLRNRLSARAATRTWRRYRRNLPPSWSERPARRTTAHREPAPSSHSHTRQDDLALLQP
jgi:tetratricopeptide (TPR) repeat protein